MSERKIAEVLAEHGAQGFDHHLVIVALRETRYRDRADHARARNAQRKCAAVRREFGGIEAEFLGERGAPPVAA